MLKSIDEKADKAGQVIKEAADTLSNGAEFMTWIKNNPKIAIVGVVALVLLLRK